MNKQESSAESKGAEEKLHYLIGTVSGPCVWNKDDCVWPGGGQEHERFKQSSKIGLLGSQEKKEKTKLEFFTVSSIFQPEILRFRTSRNQYHQVFVKVKHASLKYYCLHILTHTATFCFLIRSILSGTGRGVFSAASLFWWGLPHTYAEVAFGKFFLKHRLNLSELTLQKRKKKSSWCGFASFWVRVEQLWGRAQPLQRERRASPLGCWLSGALG